MIWVHCFITSKSRRSISTSRNHQNRQRLFRGLLSHFPFTLFHIRLRPLNKPRSFIQNLLKIVFTPRNTIRNHPPTSFQHSPHQRNQFKSFQFLIPIKQRSRFINHIRPSSQNRVSLDTRKTFFLYCKISLRHSSTINS